MLYLYKKSIFLFAKFIDFFQSFFFSILSQIRPNSFKLLPNSRFTSEMVKKSVITFYYRYPGGTF